MIDCKGFQWIGQSVAHCDGCSKPLWEHTHVEWYKPGSDPFGSESDYIPVADALRGIPLLRESTPNSIVKRLLEEST